MTMWITLWSWISRCGQTALSRARIAYSVARASAAFLSRRATLFLCPGGRCTTYVASWCGPPQPGRAGIGQLFVCDTLLPGGGVVSVLGRGMSRPDGARAQRDAQARQLELLDAQLVIASAAHGARVRDVTRLLYTLPARLSVTPFELATLMLGNVVETDGSDVRLEVTTVDTLECPLTFECNDAVSVDLIFSPRSM